MRENNCRTLYTTVKWSININILPPKVVETIPTEGFPYDLYYLQWLKEVWVHSWTNSTFDIINTDGSLKKTHKAIKAHVQPGQYRGLVECWRHFFVCNQ